MGSTRKTLLVILSLTLLAAIIPSAALAAMPTVSEEYMVLNDQAVEFATKYPAECLGIITNLEYSRYFGEPVFPDNYPKEVLDFYDKAKGLSSAEQDILIMVLASNVAAKGGISKSEAQSTQPAEETKTEVVVENVEEPEQGPETIKKTGTFKRAGYVEVKPVSFKTMDKVEAKNASSRPEYGLSTTTFTKAKGQEMIVCTIKIQNLSKNTKPIYDLIPWVKYTNSDGYTFEGTLYAEDRPRERMETNIMSLDPNTTYYLHLVCNIDKKNVKLGEGSYMTMTFYEPDNRSKTFDLNIQY